jgi:hypothetical protein
MILNVEVSTTFNADNPIYSRHKHANLGELPVAEDTIFTLGAKLEEATEKVFIPNARVYSPRRSGFLESSVFGYVTTLSNQIYLEVGAWAEYAGYMEFGTSRLSPRPFIRPALRDAYGPVLGYDFVNNTLIPNIRIWKNKKRKR